MSIAHSEMPGKLVAPYQGASTIVTLGVRNADKENFSLFGNPADAPPCAPEDIVFEIGSISKVFTALLLALLAEQGEIDPDRPIAVLCDEFASAPHQVTPRSLATHMSGLPRLHLPIWKAVFGGAGEDPYADFSRDDLIGWMQTWSSDQQYGKVRHTYSNLAFGMLGEVLAISQNRPYQELLKEKILVPLGMSDTSFVLTADQLARFAQPHDNRGRPVLPWSFKALAGAGALRSTASDLTRFSSRVSSALANPETTLDRAISRSAAPLIGLGPKGRLEPVAQCLGWVSMQFDPATPRMLFHDGGTAGSTAALYICPQNHASIVVLANRGVAAGLWSSLKLSWSNPHRLVHDFFNTG